MILTFDKHKGKSVAHILLLEPDYIRWMFNVPWRRIDDRLLAVRNEAIRLIALFNQKPLRKPCKGCGHPPTRCVFIWLMCMDCWCDDCNPSLAGGFGHLRSTLPTYEEVLRSGSPQSYVYQHDPKKLIWALALAKGLPEGAGEPEMVAFFEQPVEASR
jgi:hypothetical protein